MHFFVVIQQSVNDVCLILVYQLLMDTGDMEIAKSVIINIVRTIAKKKKSTKFQNSISTCKNFSKFTELTVLHTFL